MKGFVSKFQQRNKKLGWLCLGFLLLLQILSIFASVIAQI